MRFWALPRKAGLACLALIAAALVAAGCGSSASSSDAALAFIPNGSPLVVTVQTDSSSQQYQQLGSLLQRLPGGSSLKQVLLNLFTQNGKLDFNTDIKPVLGNDLIVAAPSVQSLRGGQSRFLVALKVGDEGKARALIQRGGSKTGTSHGVDVYRSSSGESLALDNGVLVQAPTRAELDQALARAGGSDHMTASELDARFAGLPSNALAKVGGDLQALISQSSSGGAARRVGYVNALETFGATLSAQSDGLSIDFAVRTSSAALQGKPLPIASGSQSPPVVRRPGEIGIGIRGLDQTYSFITTTAQAVSPAGLARFNAGLKRLGAATHVDVARDVIGQLSGNSSISVAPGGGFAMRTILADPTRFRATLAKLAPALPSFASGAGLRNAAVVKPSGGNPFYAVAGSNRKRYVFGVVGNAFVIATDAGRAAQFAVASAGAVPGASGALTILSDARALVAAVASRSKQAAAAQAFAGSLGDLTGWVTSGTSGLRGNLKLQIR